MPSNSRAPKPVSNDPAAPTHVTAVTGRISVHPRGFGFLNIEDRDGESAFVTPPDLNKLLEGDRIEARVVETQPGRFTAQGLRLLERSRTALFGSVTRRGVRTFLRVDRVVANTDWLLEDLPPGTADGTAVVARIDGDRARFERAVAPTEASIERVLVRHGIRGEFPAECVTQAKRARRIAGVARRRDLRDVPTVTIDSVETRDIDDALAVLPAQDDGAVRVLVSIADVDAAVPEGSDLDLEARRRGTSVYLVGRVIPMLPPELSEAAASLVPGKDRLALTVELRIAPEGEVVSVDVAETVIRSHARLTYDQVAAYLDEGRADGIAPEVLSCLRWLRTAAARLSVVRAARGGTTALFREEASVRLDADTREPTGIVARAETSAHRLVERLMVATNEAVASWLIDRGLPALHRVHDQPDRERLATLSELARNSGFEPGFGATLTPRGLAAFEAQFRGTSVEPAMRTAMLGVLGPARYSAEPRPHFGLAAARYLHFTSPIRRYADLVVHRAVKRFLAGTRGATTADPALEALAVEINRAAYAARRAEIERLQMVAARWLAPRIGERFRGNVVATKSFGVVVQLEGMGVTGTIASEGLPPGGLPLGVPLDVKLVRVDEELGRIDLERA
ncbi:MAG: RNB domain-containing ribonuclease [Deltaproteobacteria bacterium]|nr:RNB domain-containing ribonuclease [Deltaproteobacteria bacterium]